MRMRLAGRLEGYNDVCFLPVHMANLISLWKTLYLSYGLFERLSAPVQLPQLIIHRESGSLTIWTPSKVCADLYLVFVQHV